MKRVGIFECAFRPDRHNDWDLDWRFPGPYEGRISNDHINPPHTLPKAIDDHLFNISREVAFQLRSKYS